ncbi:MAG: BrnT family toxin [Nitrospinae bacterium]|nr:BrnT family toxin [Nitrospinota bacterium]
MEITWDRAKAETNRRKHGVEFAAAATVLDDPSALTVEDDRHDEGRFITVGSDLFGNILVVVFSYPDPETFRIISARRAAPREREDYEKGI